MIKRCRRRMTRCSVSVALAAMEGLFTTSNRASLAIVGQPNPETGQIDNPIDAVALVTFLVTALVTAMGVSGIGGDNIVFPNQ